MSPALRNHQPSLISRFWSEAEEFRAPDNFSSYLCAFHAGSLGLSWFHSSCLSYRSPGPFSRCSERCTRSCLPVCLSFVAGREPTGDRWSKTRTTRAVAPVSLSAVSLLNDISWSSQASTVLARSTALLSMRISRETLLGPWIMMLDSVENSSIGYAGMICSLSPLSQARVGHGDTAANKTSSIQITEIFR